MYYYLQVKPSSHGLGLFASKFSASPNEIIFGPNIDNGNGMGFICYYSKGPFMDSGTLDARYPGDIKLEYAWQGRGVEVNSNKTNDYPGRYANDCNDIQQGAAHYKHENKCNSKITKSGNAIVVKALKRIRNGQEITVAYGPSYWFKQKRLARKRITKNSNRGR